MKKRSEVPSARGTPGAEPLGDKYCVILCPCKPCFHAFRACVYLLQSRLVFFGAFDAVVWATTAEGHLACKNSALPCSQTFLCGKPIRDPGLT